MYCRAALLAACLTAVSCSRPASRPAIDRITVLRFENLSGAASVEWMARAFPEVVARDLAGVTGVYAIAPSRLHKLDPAWGKRPAGAPGISAERALALASGASRIGYGEYWQGNGRLEARLTIEDLPAGKITKVFSVSADDALGAANQLARQIDPTAADYPTRNLAALKAYVLGLEDSDPSQATQHFEAAIAADPDWEPPYELLTQAKLQLHDGASARALLDQALARSSRMPGLERAQLTFHAATLRGDAPARDRSLTAWARLTPNDPEVWRTVAEAASARHDYAQSVTAYQRALMVVPDDVVLLNQLGYAAAYAGDLATATRSLQRYATLRPGDANPLDSLGDANLALGRLKEAENFYLQAAKKDPAFEGGGDFRKAAMARLMSGDIAGADALDRQFRDQRSAAHDPLVAYYQAEWLWISGRRQDAYSRLQWFAHNSEAGPLREAASEAYSELAVWSVALGNRSEAAQMAARAGMLAGPASAGTAAVARFLAQPPAEALEWAARSSRAFPDAAQKRVRDIALVHALLVDQQFAAAAHILKPIYESGTASRDEGLPFLLAWAYLETGKPKEAAGLLRFNPILPGTGVHPSQVFYFPRLLYLRGRIAALAGNPSAAQGQFRLFLQLSGETPLVWAEEAKAR